MGNPPHFLRALARRLPRETDGAHLLESALFAAAVVAVSALAFGSTTGAMGRACARITGAFERDVRLEDPQSPSISGTTRIPPKSPSARSLSMNEGS
jgi:hypothetical protein